MSKTNRNLAIVVAVLLIGSILTYRHSVERADRFQRGQTFLSNLNPDEVSGITIVQAGESVTLQRGGDRFTVAESQGYPASNAAVNRFLRDLLAIALEREVGRGEDLASELEIEPMSDDSLEVVLQDSSAKEMVRLRVGKRFDEGPGRYVQRLDEEGAPIYLTSSGISLTTGSDAYLDKLIVDHPGSSVQRIEGPDYVLQRDEESDSLVLEGHEGGGAESAISDLESLLSGLRYDKVFVADDGEVAGLAFEPSLRIDLEDGSGYVLFHASIDERDFIRVQGYNTLQQVEITLDESQEDLEEKADKLSRADEIDDFNRFHGSWVYEVGERPGDTIRLRRIDLTTS